MTSDPITKKIDFHCLKRQIKNKSRNKICRDQAVREN